MNFETIWKSLFEKHNEIVEQLKQEIKALKTRTNQPCKHCGCISTADVIGVGLTDKNGTNLHKPNPSPVTDDSSVVADSDIFDTSLTITDRTSPLVEKRVNRYEVDADDEKLDDSVDFLVDAVINKATDCSTNGAKRSTPRACARAILESTRKESPSFLNPFSSDSNATENEGIPPTNSQFKKPFDPEAIESMSQQVVDCSPVSIKPIRKRAKPTSSLSSVVIISGAERSSKFKRQMQQLTLTQSFNLPTQSTIGDEMVADRSSMNNGIPEGVEHINKITEPGKSSLLDNSLLNASYNAVPAKNKMEPDIDAGKRMTKEERKKLDAVACVECEKYFKGGGAVVGDITVKTIQEICRHRRVNPVPGSPEGYWDIGFPKKTT